ncbi:MAG: DNA mismatch repair protein MutS [Methanoculleus sp.]|uniref:DNA mismatch repair protein MutS n=1 Tax=unclassified Methanoculleus TaxID=2619537 RepID=UPI0025CD16EE|nr:MULTISPECIES: DNA mismatch repair protein MutS [unclassified Methanoculleus]MCK9317925.1 DNA mismatch repair protein MutS [Methanoculleus sp.]MDD2253715.1 DNA mismatch repair protein MutS [Methanoculleus sp.]MDD3216988.1 DNA mismatch repair protein MutS [Methanoculleus sp.]MDD4314484.1 DNA mismatch repair protein MutS [Methanoculleus sp.]MDD4470721.1 DNA mismatch repair protein MutS [Methanoculleus sp.]
MTDGPTPAMRQYYSVKARYPDAVLFFRMGDFYETFGEDAGVVARELDITLTARGKDKNGDRMPLAGVPHHAADGYIARLVGKGYKVVICDQVEDPKTAKGVVKREVTRVITPGTLIDSSMLGSAGAHYLMAVAPDRKEIFGLAFLDVSTGEFFVSSGSAERDYADIVSETARYRPSEAIVPESLANALPGRLEGLGVTVSRYRDDAFDFDTAYERLCEQFGTATLDGYGCAGMTGAVAAAGAALRYAQETQHSSLSHITGLSTRIPSGNMVLDAITLRNLEITTGIQGVGDGNTLLAALDVTATSMGSRTMRSFLISPLIEKEAIEGRLDAVEWLVDHALDRQTLRATLGAFADIERIAGRIAYGNAGPRDLATLQESLEAIPDVKALFSGEVPELVHEALDAMSDHASVRELVGRAIVDEPPARAVAGGMIREGFNGKLDELRHLATSGKDWIVEFQQQERERTGIKSLKVGYNRVFGYYIEVTRPNLHLVPPEYERRQTTANGERYTIPDLKEKEAMIATAEERLGALEAEIYAELIRTLAADVPGLQATARAVGLLDVYAALAEVAARYSYSRPVIEESGRTIIRDGRHPVVERHLPVPFVPNDTDLDSAGDQITIITGANMAGKSTYMRAVALCCIMAQMGSFVPARHATVGVVDRVFTRVGAFDDLASGQSTFMVEMLELANILNNATPQSLVILDEIGRGTSTLDGCAIARAVVEFLHGKAVSGPRTLFATHFHDLIDLEGSLKRVKNFHFAVKDTGEDVVFLRKIIPGATDKSYGVHVAHLAGIPKKVTDRAMTLLKEASVRENSGGPRAPRYTQMLLVDPGEGIMEENPAVRELAALNPDEMTPIEALNTLCRLKRLANGEDGGR